MKMNLKSAYTKLSPIPLVMLLLGTFGCAVPQFSSTKDFSKTVPVNSKVDVLIETFNGKIEVTPSATNSIEVIAHVKAYGPTQDEADKIAELLEPKVDTSAMLVSILCEKPSSDLFTSHSVNLEVKVPPTWPLRLVTSNGTVSSVGSRASVVVETSNGTVTVDGAAGPMSIKSSNGRIVVRQSSGNLTGKTSNGSIELDRCSFEGICKLGSSNGAIKVSLLDEVPVEVTASTSNGKISFEESRFEAVQSKKSSFKGFWTGKADPSSIKVPQLQLETSNGSISLQTAEKTSAL
jgi:DUF4097 and DUF4098 domain-containing protein YvlB